MFAGGEEKTFWRSTRLFIWFFLLPLPCPAIAFGDGGTPSSFSKPYLNISIF